MRKVAAFRLFVLCVLLCCTAFGQTKSQPPIPLTSAGFTPSAGLRGNGIGLTQIGSNGFFYAQVIVGHSITTAIMRISFDGTDVRSYDVDRISRPMYLSGRTPYIESFVVGGDGSVNILTEWVKNQVPAIFTIVVFDGDGSVRNIIPISIKNAQVAQITHFARFNDGRYLLLTGYWGGESFDRVDAVLIDGSGNVVSQKPLRVLSSAEEKEVIRDVQQDIERRKAQENMETNSLSAATQSAATNGGSTENTALRPDYVMRSLLAGTVLIQGDDDNVYMIRPDHPDTLYRVSETGDITPIPLAGGSPKPSATNHDTQLTGGSIHNGELMLFYVKFNLPASSNKPRMMQNVAIEIYDLSSRQLINTYTGGKPLTPVLVGWDGNTFYFLYYSKDMQSPGFEIEKATS